MDFTVAEDEGVLYFTKPTGSKTWGLFRKPLDGSKLTFVKEVFTRQSGAFQLYLDKSGVFVVHETWNAGSNPTTKHFHFCSFTEKDVWPCPFLFKQLSQSRPGGIIMDTIHDKVLWNQ